MLTIAQIAHIKAARDGFQLQIDQLVESQKLKLKLAYKAGRSDLIKELIDSGLNVNHYMDVINENVDDRLEVISAPQTGDDECNLKSIGEKNSIDNNFNRSTKRNNPNNPTNNSRDEEPSISIQARMNLSRYPSFNILKEGDKNKALMREYQRLYRIKHREQKTTQRSSASSIKQMAINKLSEDPQFSTLHISKQNKLIWREYGKIYQRLNKQKKTNDSRETVHNHIDDDRSNVQCNGSIGLEICQINQPHTLDKNDVNFSSKQQSTISKNVKQNSLQMPTSNRPTTQSSQESIPARSNLASASLEVPQSNIKVESQSESQSFKNPTQERLQDHRAKLRARDSIVRKGPEEQKKLTTIDGHERSQSNSQLEKTYTPDRIKKIIELEEIRLAKRREWNRKYACSIKGIEYVPRPLSPVKDRVRTEEEIRALLKRYEMMRIRSNNYKRNYRMKSRQDAKNRECSSCKNSNDGESDPRRIIIADGSGNFRYATQAEMEIYYRSEPGYSI